MASSIEDSIEPANPFDIEEQWMAYLRRVNLDPTKMGPHQWQETRRAFFGAWGQAMAVVTVDLPQMEEDAAMRKITDMLVQVRDYWTKEAQGNGQGKPHDG